MGKKDSKKKKRSLKKVFWKLLKGATKEDFTIKYGEERILEHKSNCLDLYEDKIIVSVSKEKSYAKVGELEVPSKYTDWFEEIYEELEKESYKASFKAGIVALNPDFFAEIERKKSEKLRKASEKAKKNEEKLAPSLAAQLALQATEENSNEVGVLAEEVVIEELDDDDNTIPFETGDTLEGEETNEPESSESDYNDGAPTPEVVENSDDDNEDDWDVE